jgi:hypothetical protein
VFPFPKKPVLVIFYAASRKNEWIKSLSMK